MSRVIIRIRANHMDAEQRREWRCRYCISRSQLRSWLVSRMEIRLFSIDSARSLPLERIWRTDDSGLEA